MKRKETAAKIAALLITFAMMTACTDPVDEATGDNSLIVTMLSSPLQDQDGAIATKADPRHNFFDSPFRIMAYNHYGNLVAEGSGTSSHFSFDQLNKRQSYTIVAFADWGDSIPLPATLDEAFSSSYRWPEGAVPRDYLPMSGFTEVTPGTRWTSLKMYPMYSDYRISINSSRLRGSFSVTGVALRQAALRLPAFGSWTADSVSHIGYEYPDAAAALNRGDTISCVVPENLQGRLLPYNRNPWNKVPENIGGGELCTYLEVTGDYSSPWCDIYDLRYRCFLGRDNCTDFNIERGTRHQLTLNLSDSAARLAESWKVSRGYVNDKRSVRFSSRQFFLRQYDSVSLLWELNPPGIDYLISKGPDFDNCGLKFLLNGNMLIIICCEYDPEHCESSVVISTADHAKSDTCFLHILP